MFKADWTYVHASEIRPNVCTALLTTYKHRGLTDKAILRDAKIPSPFVGPCHIWSFTPPCEPFSKRNHSRSDEGFANSAEQLEAMLWYPRTWNPRIILVENVDEPAAAAIVTGALLTLPGYTWSVITTEARDYSDMCRARRMWIGVRDA